MLVPSEKLIKKHIIPDSILNVLETVEILLTELREIYELNIKNV